MNFDIYLMSTPVAQWKDIFKGYDANGVQDAIKEVNTEATKRGIE